MTPSLHLDLLKDEERFGSSPVRMRVMFPLFAISAALGVSLWWGLVAFRVHNQTVLKSALEKSAAELKPAHNALLALRAQERDTSAAIRQIQFYQNSRLRFGETFLKLAARVPENMQITEMRINPPAPITIDPQSPTPGPTNTVEQVTLRLAGRTAGERSTEVINTFITALRTPAFTNLIRSVEIPKGAFRQEFGKDPQSREALLFELICGCSPRRFE